MAQSRLRTSRGQDKSYDGRYLPSITAQLLRNHTPNPRTLLSGLRENSVHAWLLDFGERGRQSAWDDRQRWKALDHSNSLFRMSDNYLHGYDAREQERLDAQARFLEEKIYQGIQFDGGHVLEVGCGTGAQLEILARRFPECTFTGVDISELQITKAKERLQTLVQSGKMTLRKMDATGLEFEAGSFDGAFLCWVLEHSLQPLKILLELKRVLKPGAVTFVTEVQNSSLFLHPECPSAMEFWGELNRVQQTMGDPFVGAKLGHLLHRAGFQKIEIRPRAFYFDSRLPDRRKAMLDYWLELMRSALPQLDRSGRFPTARFTEVETEFQRVANADDGVFLYTFVQGVAN